MDSVRKFRILRQLSKIPQDLSSNKRNRGHGPRCLLTLTTSPSGGGRAAGPVRVVERQNAIETMAIFRNLLIGLLQSLPYHDLGLVVVLILTVS